MEFLELLIFNIIFVVKLKIISLKLYVFNLDRSLRNSLNRWTNKQSGRLNSAFWCITLKVKLNLELLPKIALVFWKPDLLYLDILVVWFPTIFLDLDLGQTNCYFRQIINGFVKRQFQRKQWPQHCWNAKAGCDLNFYSTAWVMPKKDAP